MMRALLIVILAALLMALIGCGRPQVTGNPTTWHEQVKAVQEVIAQQEGTYRLEIVTLRRGELWERDGALPDDFFVRFAFVNEAYSTEGVIDRVRMHPVLEIQFSESDMQGTIEIIDPHSLTSALPTIDTMGILLEAVITPRDAIAITMPEAERAVGRVLDREEDELQIQFVAGSDFDPADRSAVWIIAYEGSDHRLHYGVDHKTGEIVVWPDLTPPPAVFRPPYGTTKP